MPVNWNAIESDIRAATGTRFRVRRSQALGGGCINQAARIEGNGQVFFVKFNTSQRLGMFEAEAQGLEELRKSGSIRVPHVISCGSDQQQSWLVLEYLEFGNPTPSTSTELGEQLATLHRCTAIQFGWRRDNHIGLTTQINLYKEDWVDFFCECRLRYQLELATENGLSTTLLDRGEQLLEELPALFESYRPPASLLHGDLWGGNWGVDSMGQPVLFDPAVYFGDREADLAMTELFGGFDQGFYQAYKSTWPVDPGYPSRRKLYNLYHIINHFNLFGGGYARQAQLMIEELLAEMR